MPGNTIHTSIAPWLTVRDGVKAVNFYKRALGATETYRLEDPGGGLVVRLSVGGAEFWVSSEGSNRPDDSGDALGGGSSAQPLGGDSVRLILTVADPDALFAQALAAGATEIFPVGEEHGWRLGRLADPFGLHWEIGYPLEIR
jgi:PhnB protein